MLPTPAPSPIYIQMVGQESAFWDSPLFIALLTLFGVVIGALLSFLFNYLTERSRAKRELAGRFLDELLRSASSAGEGTRLLGGLVQIRLILIGYPERVRNRTSMQSQLAENESSVREQVRLVTDALSSLRLIAPLDVKKTIPKLLGKVMEVDHFAFSQDTDTAKLRKLKTELRATIETFEAAVRKNFGVSD